MSIEPARVTVDAGGIPLPGLLAMPGDATGVVVFAHGSGSSRLSPRNQAVASGLAAQGLATLLFDLLTPEEAGDRALVFDIPLLGRRLADTVAWVATSRAAGLAVGLFGASTGAAAALVAAAELGGEISAVVSRGGRPDLAGGALAVVRSPTLLIVGGHDLQVLDLNREAMARMRGLVELAVVPGAGHLFEEPGTMEEVSRLAEQWFHRHLGGAPSGS